MRDDQVACGAELAAILSAQLPKGMATFGCVDGLWITSRSCLPGLAAALRAGLIEIARTRRSLEGRQPKADHLVGSRCGAAFRLTVEGIVELYDSMKEDLNTERRAHQKMWLKREKQIERAIGGISGIVGELSGILGASLPAMAVLELTSWDGAPTRPVPSLAHAADESFVAPI